jgi:hypothetical protein
MTRAGAVLAAAMLAGAALAPAARAGFAAPVELATGAFAAAVDTDAAGTTTLVMTTTSAPRLLERPRGGAWSAAAPLPGDPASVTGPVVDAAGDGALGIAWRVDKPRTYSAIAVALRDPGGTLSAPIQVAGAAANGVRHPAIAVDPAGDALLAYDRDTRTTHLNRSGAIAVAYRRSGGSFSSPKIVDRTPSGAPAVAACSRPRR